MENTQNIDKMSAQGTRDYPISKAQNQNEDLGDVYDHAPTKQTADLLNNDSDDQNKTMLNKKRRIAGKRHSVDTTSDAKSIMNQK